jgi:hypothetical protein
MCDDNIKWLKLVIEGQFTENIMEFKYLWNRISEFKKDRAIKRVHVIDRTTQQKKFMQTKNRLN